MENSIKKSEIFSIVLSLMRNKNFSKLTQSSTEKTQRSTEQLRSNEFLISVTLCDFSVFSV